jgi:hypothetical protein
LHAGFHFDEGAIQPIHSSFRLLFQF